jgi:hypothetical protein
MEIIEINLVKLTKNNLNINEYLTILKIVKQKKGDDIPFFSSDRHLESLQSKG